MSYGLHGNTKDLWVNSFVFPEILSLAYLFGWEPRGTVAETWGEEDDTDNSVRDVGYFTNSSQTVTEEDAKGIAIALQKALQYIPDTDFALKGSIHAPKKVNSIEELKNELTKAGIFSTGTSYFGSITEEEKNELISMFIGEKDFLREFIDLCEDGEFYIS
jgi:hypothetical protein